MVPTKPMTNLALVLLAALAILAVGCAGDDGDGASEPTATAQATAEPDDEPTEPESEEPVEGDREEATAAPPGRDELADVQVGGTLTFGVGAEVAGFDPTVNVFGGCCGGSQMFALYGAMLVRSPVSGTLEPLMAQSMTSEDARTWTLVLRDGLTFSDDTRLDAAAVVFNLERAKSTPDATNQAQAAVIETATAVDDVTVEIVLAEPFGGFPWLLTRGLGAFGSPTAIEADGDGFNAEPVGAGPFTLESWSPDEETVMVRNPTWFDGPRPYLDELVFRPIAEPDQRLQTLLVGDLDMAFFLDGETLQEAVAEGLGTATVRVAAANVVNFNNTVPPFDDVRIRQAVAHALDPDAYTEIVLSGVGEATRAITADDNPFFDPLIAYLPYDPDRARELVEDYEDDNGEIGPLTFLTGQGANFSSRAEFYQAALAEIGLVVEIDSQETSAFISRIFEGDFVFSQWGIAPWDDPGTNPAESLMSGSARNWPRYADAEVDELFETVRSSTAFDERYAAFLEIQEIVAEDVPYLAVDQVERGIAWGDDVRDGECTTECVLRSDLVWIDG